MVGQFGNGLELRRPRSRYRQSDILQRDAPPSDRRNVAACRFYARMGAKLGQVHLYAYHTEGLDEVQLTWYKDL